MQDVVRVPIFLASLIAITSAVAAEKIDLTKHKIQYLTSYLNRPSATAASALSLSVKQQTRISGQSELNPAQTHRDFNGTTHYRLNQTYLGYPVWGAQALIHVPKVSRITMNGSIYKNLAQDLGAHPAFSAQQLEKAKQAVGIKNAATKFESKSIVYVDSKSRAHWAYLISYSIQTPPQKPTAIIDAKTLKVYRRWSNLQTVIPYLVDAKAGGYGGNEHTGQYTYGELRPTLDIKRDPNTSLCYLGNKDVIVRNTKNRGLIYVFSCAENPKHIYNDGYDKANGGYSPSNDALFAGEVVKQMYRDWYGVDVLKNSDGTPMVITMYMHYGDHYENAFWDAQDHYMVFGDGDKAFYPLTSVGIVAHEISHGFTQQNSNLIYAGQSGALNESFSDMAAQAAQFFVNGESSWLIGERVGKQGPIRYMYDPPLDGMSIGNANEYDQLIKLIQSFTDDPESQNGALVHLASGVYNKFFYLLGTAQGWNPHKAFNVVVKANQDYWQPAASFESAGCGIIQATEDYAKQDSSYDVATVKNALAGVGISTTQCVSSGDSDSSKA